MDKTQEAMRMMTELMDSHQKYFFNLLEVLADKGILNVNDLIYIRNNMTSEDKK